MAGSWVARRSIVGFARAGSARVGSASIACEIIASSGAVWDDRLGLERLGLARPWKPWSGIIVCVAWASACANAAWVTPRGIVRAEAAQPRLGWVPAGWVPFGRETVGRVAVRVG